MSSFCESYGVGIMLLVAVILMIASICVPYYTDSAGVNNGVFVDKMCLGLIDEHECNASKALPIMTILLGVLTIAMAIAAGTTEKWGFVYKASQGVMKVMDKFHITLFVMASLAAIFSLATYAFQMAIPVAGDTLNERSLMDKSNNRYIEFKEGMYLSLISMILFGLVFVILMFFSKNE